MQKDALNYQKHDGEHKSNIAMFRISTNLIFSFDLHDVIL